VTDAYFCVKVPGEHLGYPGNEKVLNWADVDRKGDGGQEKEPENGGPSVKDF
jgi:hypothetical protein